MVNRIGDKTLNIAISYGYLIITPLCQFISTKLGVLIYNVSQWFGMVQYTLAQCPEVTLSITGRDSQKTREKAMDQLIELMDAGKLPVDLSDGFSPQQLIEVKSQKPTVVDEEAAVVEAVQILNNLATLKLKAQNLRSGALEVRSLVDLLFTDEQITEEQIDQLKKGFKTLKDFAQANLRYRSGRSEAEDARTILDAALSND